MSEERAPGDERAAGEGRLMDGGPAGAWHRLHPLSPVVRSGRGVLAVAVAVAISRSAATGSHWLFDLALPVVAAGAAVVSWLVTRWRLDGVTLRIESGLIRRDSRQLPVARIQAVDVVRPFLARALGLAELRVRLAGSSDADGRLAYLTEPAALELRARLLAAHHGLDPATPAPPERIAVTVPTGRLVGSVALSTAGPAAAMVVLAGVLLAFVSAAALAALAISLVWLLIVCLSLVWRRVSTQYSFTVAQSPDGIRIRRGLLGTVAETIPLQRVQAVRMIEPLLWRPLHWYRLEVDVAGSPGRDSADGTARMRKTLLPVGGRDEAGFLLTMAVGAAPPGLTRPPGRARWKALLSYHFLAAGHDGRLAVSVVGRLRKVTTVVPLAKTQSVRLVQGPLQRRLALATVHLDAAGHVRAEFRERPQEQARRLVDELAGLSREARRLAPPARSAPVASAAAGGSPAGGTQAAAGAAAGPQATSVASPVNAAQSEA
ncbi:MAG TPA: PH domain-containing protein [Streptosporangiaceae bacterium]|nr:PH domain-containing protein [Streptosporangiaceae bacterium]